MCIRDRVSVSPGFDFFISLVFMIPLRSVNCWSLVELGLSRSWQTQDLFTSGFLFKERQLWGVPSKLKHTSMLSSNEQQEEQKCNSSYRVWSLRKKIARDDSQPRTPTASGQEERVWSEQVVVHWNCQDYSLVNSELCTEFSGLCVETSTDLPISAGSCCFGQQSLM